MRALFAPRARRLDREPQRQSPPLGGDRGVLAVRAIVGVVRAQAQLAFAIAKARTLAVDSATQAPQRPHTARGAFDLEARERALEGQPRMERRHRAQPRQPLRLAEEILAQHRVQLRRGPPGEREQAGRRIEAVVPARADRVVGRIERRAIVVVVEEVAARALVAHVHERGERPARETARAARLPGLERAARHAQIRRRGVRDRDQVDRAARSGHAEPEGREPAIDLDALDGRGRQVGEVHDAMRGGRERHAVEKDRDVSRRRAAQRHRAERAEPAILEHVHARGLAERLRQRLEGARRARRVELGDEGGGKTAPRRCEAITLDLNLGEHVDRVGPRAEAHDTGRVGARGRGRIDARRGERGGVGRHGSNRRRIGDDGPSEDEKARQKYDHGVARAQSKGPSTRGRREGRAETDAVPSDAFSRSVTGNGFRAGFLTQDRSDLAFPTRRPVAS